MTNFVLEGVRNAVPYVADTAGQVALAYATSAINSALNSRTLDGPRLESLHIQTSRDGAPMPRVFGRTRLAGQVIWASNFKEAEATTQDGGKGGGPKIRNYSYTVSFAVGLCEGEIMAVERLWANGEALKKSGLNCRVYTGSERQNPDPIITLIDGPDAPAFRGTAYIVFEDFPLDEYGARLPQINAEIVRMPARQNSDNRLEDLIEGVDLIPGSGEFVYAPEPVEDVSVPGQGRTININNLSGITDMKASLDQLQAGLPNCKSINIIASWFGDNLNCGVCKLRPGVESRDMRAAPDKWHAGGKDRSSAYLISRLDDKPVYGGTPSDQSLKDLIAEIKVRGLKASFYPFVIMDINPDLGQPDFPWRGRITSPDDRSGSAASEVDNFFGHCEPSDFTVTGTDVNYSGPKEDSFRRMILHYAALCKAAGGVDSFVIGSEMSGLTTIRGADLSYPAVTQFKRLAADVRAISGPQTKLTYAADWSEYFGHHKDGNTIFHLDPLWSDENIDAVAIDAYFPLSDARDGDDSRPDFTANIEGGEGYDWYYKTPEDRASKTRTQITDGAYQKPWVYRFKDIRNWWKSPHYDRIDGIEGATSTDWVPQSKPVWLTEVGCPAVDKGANQPNVFYDPKSSESFFPYFSSGQRDDFEQRDYLRALIGYWQPEADHNPISDIYAGPMIDPARIHVWSWDARPFPDFPARTDIWSDGPNWARGHWITGRVGVSSLADVVYDITARSPYEGEIDVSNLAGLVRGYTLDRPMSPRVALEPLAQAYGFTCIETPGGLRFQMSGSGAVKPLSETDIALNPQASDAPPLTVKRDNLANAPQDVRLHYININADYQRGMASAVNNAALRDFVTDIQAPLVLDPGAAKAMSEAMLARALSADHTLVFTVMPGASDAAPGDTITLPGDMMPGGGSYVIESLDGLFSRNLVARPLFKGASAPANIPVPTSLPSVTSAPVPQIAVLDIGHLSANTNRAGPLVAAFSRPWSPVTLSAAGQSVRIEQPSCIGRLTADLPRGPVGRFNRSWQMDVYIPFAQLASAPLLDVLSGQNALAVETDAGFEIIQYERADLTGTHTYRLTGLLRGQAGSDGVTQDVIRSGAQVVCLTAGLKTLPIDPSLRGAALGLTVSADARSDSQTETLDYKAVHLIPLAPVHLRAQTLPDGGVHISWMRRTRIGGDDWAARDVPIGEDEERYSVEIVSEGEVAADFEVMQPDLTLTPAQTAGLPPGPLTARIAQISRVMGGGV